MAWAERFLGIQASTPGPIDDFWYRPVSDAPGSAISATTAMSISSVFACVRVISEDVGSLPLPTFREREGGGKDRDKSHPLYAILHDQPNPRQTSMDWRQYMTAWAMLRGDAYSEILPGRAGEPWQLKPLHPDNVRIEELGGDMSVRYHVRQRTGIERPIPEERMFHLRGLSLDGVHGVSVLEYARQSFGLARDAETYGASFLKNGAKPAVILRHPGELSTPAKQRLKDDWNQAVGGPTRAGGTAVVEEGMDVTVLTLSNRDSQWLEGRKFQRSEIASWFRIPPHLIGDLEHATFSNVEHQSLDYVKMTLRPWLVRWEQSLRRCLFTPLNAARGEDAFAEFVVEGLLRGDIASRFTAYATARNWGWFNVDEIRERENMNPLPDGMGEIYLQPLNMVPAGTEPAALKASAGGALSESVHEQAMAIAEEAAARLVRREQAAVVKAGQRHAADAAGFMAEVNEFYDAHAATVASTMRVSLADARRYCAGHKTAVELRGAAAIEEWGGSARELAGLAFGLMEVPA